MPGRSVLQWDKDDCAAIGLVKFDLLGLGMLEALHRMVDLVRGFHGVSVDLAQLPQEDEVYDLLCRADTVGVFQVESRAQMGTLPRVQPREFYDLAIEVALIRPGPIQGHAVNPYIRRRRGEEEVTYLHPLLEPILKRTLGVPLFQEQLMEMAVAIAGFTRPRPTSCARPWRPSARPPAWRRCGCGCTRGWPGAGWRARWPTRSSPPWPPSPTSASPSRTRCRSRSGLLVDRG